jgi:hypothetical protein
MRNMNFVLWALIAISSLAAPLAAGQGGNPRASSEESEQTSAVATSVSGSRVLMEEMTTTEVRDAIRGAKPRC